MPAISSILAIANCDSTLVRFSSTRIRASNFGIANSHALRIRERLLRLNRQVTGHRLLRGAIRIGGTRVLTPPDPVSQIIMALPMCLLYEVCIWVIRLRELAKGEKAEEPAAA